jgi:hypothetical protein
MSASCTLVGTTTCRRPAAGGRVDALLPGGVPAPVLCSTSWMADGRRRLGRTRRRGFLDGEFAGERTEGESSRPLEIGVRASGFLGEGENERKKNGSLHLGGGRAEASFFCLPSFARKVGFYVLLRFQASVEAVRLFSFQLQEKHPLSLLCVLCLM